MIALGYGLALLIGLSLGLLGGGGSILTVPVLHYVMGYPVRAAVPMSLVVVGMTSGFAAFNHWRAGTVRWRAAMAFAPTAIAGSIFGADLGLRVDPSVQLAVFGVVMLVAALSMLSGGVGEGPRPAPRPLPLVSLIGAAVGLLTGFVGVGGGFLYVPALALLAGLEMKSAVGTSLVLIMLSSLAGVARYQVATTFDWGVIGVFTAIAFVGVLAGLRIVRHVSSRALRRGFGVFVFLMGALVLIRGR